MAKQNKSGLGRGLNSLLSGSVDEAIPVEPQETKERVKVEPDKELPQETPKEKQAAKAAKKPSEKPTPAKKPLSPPAQGDRSSRVAAQAGGRAAEVPEQQGAFAENDDHVTIKKVVERERKTDELPLSAISPNPDQPRTYFKKEEIEELASSIEKEGLLQPILVRKINDSSYQIIAGERRWQACKALGLPTVPVRVKEASDDKALELALIENIQRSDLNPIEEAYGYRRLMERQNLTQLEVAQTVSKGRSTVANALRLLELPEEAQQMLFEEKISSGHARAILSIPAMEDRQRLTDKLLKEKLSVREAEVFARLFAGKQGNEGGAPVRTPTPNSFKTVARALRAALNTNVRVKTVQGKNKIEIEFKDEEELEQLYDNLTAFENF